MTKVEEPGAPAGEKPEAREDVLFVHSPSEDGQGYRVIRKRADTLELGELRTLEEGRPLHGDLVQLKPRKEHERLFDVDVVVEAPRAPDAPRARRSGPAQVATAAYRSNWEAIFGASDEDEAPN